MSFRVTDLTRNGTFTATMFLRLNMKQPPFAFSLSGALSRSESV